MFELTIAAIIGGLVTSLGFGSTYFFAKMKKSRKQKSQVSQLANSDNGKIKEIASDECMGNTGFHSYDHFVDLINKLRKGRNTYITGNLDKLHEVLMNGKSVLNNATSIEYIVFYYNQSLINYSYPRSSPFPAIHVLSISPLNVMEIEVGYGDNKKKFLIGENGENVDSIIEDYLEYSKVFDKVDELKNDMIKYKQVNNPDSEIINSVNEKINEGNDKMDSIKKKVEVSVEGSRNFKETEQGIELLNKSISTVF